MILRPASAGTLGRRIRFGILLGTILAAIFLDATLIYGQRSTFAVNSSRASGDDLQVGLAAGRPETGSLDQFLGLKVVRVDFEGVDPSRFTPPPERLAELIGTPLTQENLARSLRLVFASGLFETVEVDGTRDQGAVWLLSSRGRPACLLGR